jgi:hypothetical protein
MRTVAFLIAASPNDAFYSQIAALRAGLRALTWSHWRWSVYVFVGGDRRQDTVLDWHPYLRDVQISWTSDARFAREGDWAQSDDAFRFAPQEADVLVALDADTFPIAGFESMLDRVYDTGAVAGVIAHSPPMHSRPLRDVWAQLARGVTDVPLDFAFTHTLVGPERPPDERQTPFYLNFGVVALPRGAFDAVAPRYLDFRQLVTGRMNAADFSGQVALTLAIADAGIRTWALPIRYNFPNDALAETMYPSELQNVAIVHYLRTTDFDRHEIFARPEAYSALLQQPLSGASQVFRDAVGLTLGQHYPFPRHSRMPHT